MKKLRNESVLSESVTIFVSGVCFKNPILIGALGLYPVVAAGYCLRNGVALSIMMLIMMLPTCLISSFAGKSIPNWIRPAVVLLLSAAFYLPSQILVEKMMQMTSQLGICGGMMVANSIILSRANDYAPEHIEFAVLADSLGCTVGFSVVICFISAIREILSTGNSGAISFLLSASQKRRYQSRFLRLYCWDFWLLWCNGLTVNMGRETKLP